MTEPTTDTAESVEAKDEAAAESQVASATSAPDSPEAAVSTSPQDDTSEAGATIDEAGAVSQVPAAPSNTPKNGLMPTAEEYVTQSAGLDDGGCFEPFVERRPPTLYERVTYEGLLIPTIYTITKAVFPAPATDGSKSDAEVAKPSEIQTAPAQAPLSPPRVATAAELILWITLCLQAQTHLPVDAAKLIAFWVIAAWFRTELTILPCLLITGPAYDSGRVLRVLKDFFRQAALLPGFRRSDLVPLCSYETLLISEPNLDRRTANLLSGLTDRKFDVVRGSHVSRLAKSTAIYAGENPETHKIQNSIHIHISPSNAALPDPPQWLQKMTDRLPVHLGQYCNKNVMHVLHSKWVPSGLSAEATAIATALGSCIVDAPELRLELLALLQTQDQQRLSAMSNSAEAVVLEALLALIREGRKQAYAQEIADGANRRFDARGETARLSAENVGHVRRRLGLPTRRLSDAGNGLIFDNATVAKLKQLAAKYGMEDTSAETENLLCQQAIENKQVE